MNARLVLGTAQFGAQYGIANKSGQVEKDEVFRILKYAHDQGIKKLDTAYAYGESQNLIEEFIAREKVSFDLISKVKAGQGPIRDAVETSLQTLQQERMYGLLVHSYEDFNSHSALWNELRNLKEEGKVKNIGFSLYSPDELDDLFDKKIDFDMVQFPYNLFDRRFESRFQELKEHAVEIHVRSVFLQGLVFLDPNTLTRKPQGSESHLKKLNSIAHNSGLSLSAICLNFAFKNEHIDHIVIGVDSLSQLKTNVDNLRHAAAVASMESELRSLSIDDEKILMPHKWELV